MCSEEELGLSGNGQKFWPIVESQQKYFNTFSEVFLCADQTKLELLGNVDTSTGKSVFIDIVKCTGHDYCKSDEQI